jgi:Flp pilus assembly protein TadG
MRIFLKRRRLLKLGRRQEGAAVVEFALCLIPLLLILGGVIDFGQAWYMKSMLATASRAGARYATRYYDPTNSGQTVPAASRDVPDYLAKNYNNLLPDLAVTVEGASNSTAKGAQVGVKVTAPKDWFILGHLVPDLPSHLSSTTWMAME